MLPFRIANLKISCNVVSSFIPFDLSPECSTSYGLKRSSSACNLGLRGILKLQTWMLLLLALTVI